MSSKLVAVFGSLHNSANTSYVVSYDRVLLRRNAAWDAFARANGGEAVVEEWGVGTSILDAMDEEQRAFFAAGFDRACATGERWEHDYECSSPDEERHYRMFAYPIGNLLVITHARRVDDVAPYASVELVAMCAHCRCVRDPAAPDRWQWVPDFVASMPRNTTHGLCPTCERYYYHFDAE